MKRTRVLSCKYVSLFLLCLAFLAGPTLAGAVTYQYDSKHRVKKATYDNGLAITYQYDSLGNRSVKSSITVNLNPYIPSNPFPVDGAVDMDVYYGAELFWTGGDPNTWDIVTYDLYLDETTDPALLLQDITETTMNVTDLVANTSYSWKIVAKDQGGLIAEGPVWNFSVIRVDTDGDGIQDGEELEVYFTDPNLADTDADGLDDGAERTLWGNDWNADIDGDSLDNLHDSDSDNDGYLDGLEVAEGTDPGDADSNPKQRLLKYFLIIDS